MTSPARINIHVVKFTAQFGPPVTNFVGREHYQHDRNANENGNDKNQFSFSQSHDYYYTLFKTKCTTDDVIMAKTSEVSNSHCLLLYAS
jgi:hypothetical protein